MSTQSSVTWSNRLRSKNQNTLSSPQSQPRQAELRFSMPAFSISEESVWECGHPGKSSLAQKVDAKRALFRQSLICEIERSGVGIPFSAGLFWPPPFAG